MKSRQKAPKKSRKPFKKQGKSLQISPSMDHGLGGGLDLSLIDACREDPEGKLGTPGDLRTARGVQLASLLARGGLRTAS